MKFKLFVTLSTSILCFCSGNAQSQVKRTITRTSSSNVAKNKPANNTKKHENNHEYIDLGLSVYWAAMNIGADRPEDLGFLYAWAETEQKKSFSWENYKYAQNEWTYTKYCKNKNFGIVDNKQSLEIEDDAAHVNWGGKWRLPTMEEAYELHDKCTWKFTRISNTPGYKVIGPNGNSIFIPAIGQGDSDYTYGDYWLSTNISPIDDPFLMEVLDYSVNMCHAKRYRGCSIRPVFSKTNTLSQQEAKVAAFNVKGVSFEMIKVKGGTFTMGATQEIKQAYEDEKPAHKVTLNDFYVGKTEVTTALWEAVMDYNPSLNERNQPVANVSWNDCQKFIAKLNALTNKRFRLLTEAEWEFVARGGNNSRHTQYSGSEKLDDVALYQDNWEPYSDQTVAKKLPNELGVYDMSGNVSEWCQDWMGEYQSTPQVNPKGPKTGTHHVIRGGSWSSIGRYCRVTNRGQGLPTDHADNWGFRLALSE